MAKRKVTEMPPVSDHAPASAAVAMPFAVAELHLSQTNPRAVVANAAHDELTESIRRDGILQPLVIRPIELDGRVEGYEVVCGARRFRAAKLLGLATVPATVRELTDEQAAAIQLVENLQREDLSPLEEARGLAALRDLHQRSPEAIAVQIGRSVSYVYNRLRLLALCAGARTALQEGAIDLSRAMLLVGLEPKRQVEALVKFTAPRWKGADDLPSLADCRAILRLEFLTELAKAPFSTSAVDLVPGAGPCGRCPKRSGAQPELFAEVARADSCLDPDCWAAKAEAGLARRRAEILASGRGIVTEKKAAEAILYGSSAMRLDETCYESQDFADDVEDEPGDEDDDSADEPEARTYRQVLEDAGVRVEAQAVEHNGELVEVADRNEAMKALAAAGVEWAKDQDHGVGHVRRERKLSKEEREAEEAREIRAKAVELALPDLVEAGEASTAAMGVLGLVVGALCRGNRPAVIAAGKRRGIDLGQGEWAAPAPESLAELTRGQRQGLAVELIATNGAPSGPYADDYSVAWREACEALGIDMAKYEAAAKAETKAKPGKGKKGKRS